MAFSKFLDYEGLAHVLSKINEKYAPIQAIIFKATVPTISSLPNISTEVEIGWMYNVTTGGQTTSDFTVGPGKTLQDDENVVAVNIANEGETPVLKWDIVGGVFKIEDRLQFGTAFPSNPNDGDTFLYMGETVYAYRQVTPRGNEDPSELGWYEYNDVEETYVLSEDTQVDPNKTYYSRYEKYAKGVIYIYRLAANNWIAQTSSDTIMSISISDINKLFN